MPLLLKVGLICRFLVHFCFWFLAFLFLAQLNYGYTHHTISLNIWKSTMRPFRSSMQHRWYRLIWPLMKSTRHVYKFAVWLPHVMSDDGIMVSLHVGLFIWPGLFKLLFCFATHCFKNFRVLIALFPGSSQVLYATKVSNSPESFLLVYSMVCLVAACSVKGSIPVLHASIYHCCQALTSILAYI